MTSTASSAPRRRSSAASPTFSGNVETVVRLLSDGTLRTAPLISDIIGLDEVISVGFKRMLEPTKDIFRILVSPSGEK